MQKYTKVEVLAFISLIRKTFGRYKEDSGGCYKFHLILKKMFECEGYYNSDHVITEISGTFYDIDGEVITPDESYLPIEDYGYDHMDESFKEHL